VVSADEQVSSGCQSFIMTSSLDSILVVTSVLAASLVACSGDDASVGPAADSGVTHDATPDSRMDDASVDAADGSSPDASGTEDVRDAAETSVAASPSCAGGLKCGSASCCEAKLVPASTSGTLPMGRSAAGTDKCPSWDFSAFCPSQDGAELPEHPATVSDFKLDTFEVTVGRYRKFVEAYPASKPVAGAGAHPKVATSGWDATWPIAVDRSALIGGLQCDAKHSTWTDAPGANENKAITCIDWYEAFAFCAWDGGRLPTSAEWEYAAAGGSENRLLPWGGTAAPDCAIANVSGCGDAIVDVGATPLGAGKWGHQDLGGNVYEWIVDGYSPYSTAACNDCIDKTATAPFDDYRLLRGGYYGAVGAFTRAVHRQFIAPTYRALGIAGFRCARTP
jgi:formylglycine-generating enzyme